MAKKEGFFAEFKKFITKGNILDMAVGVVMGGAFGKIVTSLVNDVIMPAVGALMGGQSVSDLKYVITDAVLAEDGVTVVTPEVAIKYGSFIQYIVDFLIVAFCMFCVIRIFMKMRTKLESMKKKEEEVVEEAAPAEPTVEEKTLATLNDIKALLEKKENND
ncbi:MAG: large conductance mechanosensitive channel protein MscL [Ruminococcaceae bacterium]|nr:large conductance mechanosensitive channel protein MscL [Oscillospiraceae bacterium]